MEQKLIQKQMLEIEYPQQLKMLLTDDQIACMENGSVYATCQGQKVGLQDQVFGVVILLSPLQGG